MTPLDYKDENSFGFSLFVDVRFKICNVVLIWIKHALLFQNTVEPPLTTTSTQWPPTATSLQWFFFSWRIRSIHWILFQPLYNGHLSSTAIFLPADSPYIDSCVNLFTTATCLLWPLYYIDTDEIPGFFLILKNHIFIARSEDTIFIFHVWGYCCRHGY